MSFDIFHFRCSRDFLSAYQSIWCNYIFIYAMIWYWNTSNVLEYGSILFVVLINKKKIKNTPVGTVPKWDLKIIISGSKSWLWDWCINQHMESLLWSKYLQTWLLFTCLSTTSLLIIGSNFISTICLTLNTWSAAII